MPETHPLKGYSAKVKIDLFMNDRRFSVGQVGGGMLIFDEPTALPDTSGELVLTVDGHEHRWAICLESDQPPARIIHAEFREIN
ncbi:MAG TPA: hypothetical protein VN541_06510 [Tepidisphaeraceae bacterium]|nr:hypothetical protein [Tepidisphaeraceae bacterium]